MCPVEFWRRLRALGRKGRNQQELEDEMRLHLQLRKERLEAGGLSSHHATLEAQKRFGSLLRHREDGIEQWGWPWLEQLLQDLRFGARTLRMHPGFAVTVILTLALATGATTSIFSIVNGVLLRPLPFADPDRLVQVYGPAERPGRPCRAAGVSRPQQDVRSPCGVLPRYPSPRWTVGSRAIDRGADRHRVLHRARRAAHRRPHVHRR
jgi:hypothetical protein